jgi:hypothetical protein
LEYFVSRKFGEKNCNDNLPVGAFSLSNSGDILPKEPWPNSWKGTVCHVNFRLLIHIFLSYYSKISIFIILFAFLNKIFPSGKTNFLKQKHAAIFPGITSLALSFISSLFR